MKIRNHLWTAGLLMLGPVLVGCGDSRVPEQQAAQDPATGELPAGHPPTGQVDPNSMLPVPVVGQGAGLNWTMPDGWIEEPPANLMRQAQYRVPGSAGDGLCVVYYFGAGQGGTPQANAERWAEQFVQPDGSPSREALTTSQTTVNDLSVLSVEITGTYMEGGMMMTGAPGQEWPGYMLSGAIIEGPDANWFFKLTGPEATVQENSTQFEALVNSVRKTT